MEETEKKKQNEKGTKDKLFNFRPLFFCACFLAFGIFFAYLRIYHGVSAWWILLCIPVSITPFFFLSDKKKIFSLIKSLTAVLFAFLVGFLAFSYQADEFDDCPHYEGEYTVIGRVKERTEYENWVRLVLTDLRIEQNETQGRMEAYLPVSYKGKIEIADKVLLTGTLKTNVDPFNGYGFRADEIDGKLRYEMPKVQSCMVTGKVFQPFDWIRNRMVSVIYAGMDETSAGVTVAVLTGDTSGIEAGLLSNVRYGGIAHIFAVSGLHIGALYAFCLALYKKTPLKNIPKICRFLLLGVLLIFYAGMCGFTASVVRATVLCLTAYAFTLLLLKRDFLESLGFSAIVVLLLSPVQLFLVGFQLSFGACLGIALLNRPISKWLEKGYRGGVSAFTGKIGRKILARTDNEDLPPTVWERCRRAVFSFLSVSLSAQIATTPILLDTFGYASGLALVLNGMFVPLISLSFSLLLGLGCVVCLLPIGLSAWILYLPRVLWSGCLLLFEVVDFSAFALSGIKLSFFTVAIYALGCTLFSDKWNLSKFWRTLGIGICFTAFFVGVLVLNIG